MADGDFSYVEAKCKNCGSKGYRNPEGTWVHNWGSAECAERPVFEPDFFFNR